MDLNSDNNLYLSFLKIFFLFSFVVFIKSLVETSKNKNAFLKTPYLLSLGVFVWGDGVILSLFWMTVSLISYLLKNFYLFLLITSSFWLIRSFGEVIYWLNQQFSSIKRNPPEKLFGYRIFKNESLWFAYQLFWQCVFVLALILTLYFANLWLKTLK